MFLPHSPPVAAPPEATQTGQVTSSVPAQSSISDCPLCSAPGPLSGLEGQQKVKNRPTRRWMGKLGTRPDSGTHRDALCSMVPVKCKNRTKHTPVPSCFLSLYSEKNKRKVGSEVDLQSLTSITLGMAAAVLIIESNLLEVSVSFLEWMRPPKATQP